MGGFTNPTIGGGNAYNDLLGQLMSMLGQDQQSRANLGLGLYTSLLEAQSQARDRGGLGLVDQLALGHEVGNIFPLSQASQQQLSRYRAPKPGGALTDSLSGMLGGYAQQAIPQGEIQEVYNLNGTRQALIRLPDGSMDWVALPEGEGVQQMQGRAGPYMVNLDDAGRLLQQQRGGGPSPYTNEQISAALGKRFSKIESYMGKMRTGSPMQRERLRRLGIDPTAEDIRQLTREDPEYARQVYADIAAARRKPAGMQFGGSVTVYPRPAGMRENAVTGPPNRQSYRGRIGRLPRLAGQYGGEGITPTAPYRRRRAPGMQPRLDAQGPVTINEGGRPIAQVGEGQGIEDITVTPRTGISPGEQATVMPQPTAPPSQAELDALPQRILDSLSRVERFRLEQVQELYPHLPLVMQASLAKNSQDFDALRGFEPDEFSSGARLLGDALAGDTRFRDPFVRALAQGRAPSPAEATMADLQTLSPDLFNSLASVIGPDLMQEWMWEQAAYNPRGIRTQQATGAGFY